jgi:hypothetical protein
MDVTQALSEVRRLRRRNRVLWGVNAVALIGATAAAVARHFLRGHLDSATPNLLMAPTVQTAHLDILDESGQVRGSLYTEGDTTRFWLDDYFEVRVTPNQASLWLRGPNGQVMLGVWNDRAELRMQTGPEDGLHGTVSLTSETTATRLEQATFDGPDPTSRFAAGARGDGAWLRLWSASGQSWQVP